MTTNVIPCGHRILVKPEKFTDVDPTLKRMEAMGFKMVESEARKEQAAMDRGIVIAVGPSAFKDFGGEAWCKVGDKIAFAKYGGKFIDETNLILNDEDVVAVLKENND